MITDDQPSPKSVQAARGAQQQTDPAASQSWRPFLMTVVGFIASLLALVLFLEYYVAHRLPPLTEDALNAAQKKWDANKPASYNLDLEIRGGEPGTASVEVRNGEVVACQRNGITPDERRVWDVWTVTGQFKTLEQEMRLAADPVHQINASPGTRLTLQCEFDPHYGYPQQYHRIVSGSGVPEVFWRTTKFEPK